MGNPFEEELNLAAELGGSKGAFDNYFANALVKFKIGISRNEFMKEKGLLEKIQPIDPQEFIEQLHWMREGLQALLEKMNRKEIKIDGSYSSENIQQLIEFVGALDLSDLDEQKIKSVIGILDAKKAEIFLDASN